MGAAKASHMPVCREGLSQGKSPSQLLMLFVVKILYVILG
jgi:hypothetical protein